MSGTTNQSYEDLHTQNSARKVREPWCNKFAQTTKVLWL